MYKNPELSAQAKSLRKELATLGLLLSHAQTLELLAKSQGARTLHVANAKHNKQGVDIERLALAQASALMFESLGPYESDVRGLLDAIKAGFDLEDSGGSRAVEAEMHRLFGGEGAAKVQPAFDAHRLDELPMVFEALYRGLLQTLTSTFGVQAKADDGKLYRGPFLDWRVQEGTPLSELPAHQRTAFEVEVARNACQLYVDISLPHSSPEELEGTAQMSLFIEVNEGRPCVHLTNDRYGDQVLTVFATADGLYLRPDSEELSIRTGAPNEGSELRQLEDDLQVGFSRRPWNTAFIPTR